MKKTIGFLILAMLFARAASSTSPMTVPGITPRS